MLLFRFLALAFLAVFLGCHKQSASCVDVRPHSSSGTPVATFDSGQITIDDLKKHLMELPPYARARYQAPEQKKQLVAEMVRFDVLVDEALRRGFNKDADVVNAAKRVMVQKLLRQQLDESATAIPDADLSAYYDAHKADYNRPEQLRLSQIFIQADSPATRNKKKAEAEAILKRAKALPPMDFAAFGKLASETSQNPATKMTGGDMRYLPLDEIKTQYGAPVAEAAARLTQVGTLSGVIETEKGFYILKLLGKQNGIHLAFDQVKEQIRSRLVNERRQKRSEQFVEEVRKNANVKINEPALEAFQVDTKSPSPPAH